MAPPSEERAWVGATQQLVEEPCDLCTGEDRVTVITRFGANNRARIVLRICTPCAASIISARTGFRFVNQLNNWDSLRKNLRSKPLARKAQ